MTVAQRLALYISFAAIAGFLVVELPHAKRFSYHGLVQAMDVPAMAADADVMLSGTVAKELGTVRAVGPAGEDMVYTRWQIKPGRVTKGSVAKPVTVRTLGGQYNLTFMDVEDQPTFTTGERVALFLKSQSDWKGDYRVVGEFQGKFTLNGSGTATTAVQAETNKQYTLGELEQAVISTK